MLRALILLLSLSLLICAAQADSQAILDRAIQEYNAGKTDKAFELLLAYLNENPNDPRTHYYLGLALKKLGQDDNAVTELETAVKLAPPGTIKALAKQALSDNTKQNGWGFPMPDIAGSIRHVVVESKRWMKSQGHHRHPSANYLNDVSAVMPMEDMLAIAEDSHQRNPKWQSDASGVVPFEQSPENSAEWEHWISRFTRNFDGQLFRHLAQETQNEGGGFIAVIFSVDKEGHLRGAIYRSTADERMNQCVLEAIRDLNRSYLLAFPSNTRVTGWNFRMDWTLDRALAFIHGAREAQAKAAADKAARVKLTIDAKLKLTPKMDEKKAKAKLLTQNAIPTTKAKILPPPQVKTNVSAQLWKPVELKATAMKLSDMPDLQMSNGRDVSTLFH